MLRRVGHSLFCPASPASAPIESCRCSSWCCATCECGRDETHIRCYADGDKVPSCAQCVDKAMMARHPHCRIGRVWAKLPNGGQMLIALSTNRQPPNVICDSIAALRRGVWPDKAPA